MFWSEHVLFAHEMQKMNPLPVLINENFFLYNKPTFICYNKDKW